VYASVRREEEGDHEAVARVIAEAFAREDPAGFAPLEVALVEALRCDAAWIPPLSLVAEVDGQVVGYALCTRATIADVAVLALGPIGVLPPYQRHGIGTQLMNAMIVAAGLHGEAVICLVGDPAFYGRFGFSPASRLGIDPPDPQWGDAFQALVALSTTAPDGQFRYAAPFREFD